MPPPRSSPTTIAILGGSPVAESTRRPQRAAKDNFIRPPGGESVAQQENVPNQPQPERYYSEYIPLAVKDDALRGVITERQAWGWKLISALKTPSGDALRLEWDTSGSFSR